ncbi:MAG: hypothetical protein PHN82_01870 [bacterium]|nr:hypothetical protein [bacterium]
MIRRFVRLCGAGALAAAVLAAVCAPDAAAEPVLVYSQDWSGGAGGWGGVGGFGRPNFVRIGHPLAQYGWYFGGGRGLGFRADTIPQVRMKVSTLVYMEGSNRNGFSVNVRTRGGVLVYKYSMGGGNRVDANCQPPTDHIRVTRLSYALRTPYELSSYWFPGTGRFAVGLKNMLTGEEKFDGFYHCRSKAAPGMITFDQEGGRGPAYLGRVEVWLGQ